LLVMAQRAQHAPTGTALSREEVSAWLRTRVEGLRALHPLVGQLSPRSPDDALYAAVLYGRLVDELRTEIEGLPPLAGIVRDQEAAWRSALAGSVVPLVRGARDAWRRCARVAPQTSPVLQGWGPDCTAQAEMLGARLEAAEPTPPRAPTVAVSLPPECEGPEWQQPVVDPEAPAPNRQRPAEIVLWVAGDRFVGADAARLRNAVQTALRTTVRTRFVPAAEVDAALALRQARRWRPTGPVCGQPPPLAAVLAPQHPHLILGRIETWCGTVSEEGQPERESCTLSVQFHRAGSDDGDGVPLGRSVDVTGARNTLPAWLAAAARLQQPETRSAMGGLFGTLMTGPDVVYRALGYASLDPWLRVGPTLTAPGDDSVREALTACASPEAVVGSYDLAWTISPVGSAESVTVTPRTTAGERSGDAVAACLRAVLGRTGWPCPRDGVAARVEARLCLGRSRAQAAATTP